MKDRDTGVGSAARSIGLAGIALLAGAFLAISIAEAERPLRKRREPRLRRMGRNLALAGITAAVTTVLQIPILGPLQHRTRRGRLGLLHRLPLPRPLRIAAGVLLLDYTLWWWHWMNHKVPFLWRFHLVHHVDLDLDASTGLRFHFGEMGLSVAFRALQIRLLGVEPLAVKLWQMPLMLSILFHHSNVELPWRIEQGLVRMIVTPRMHGIHHSAVRDETDSNWSSLLSVWDFIHGTFRFDVPQEAISIGVPAWQDPEDVTLGRMLASPFEPQRDDWIDAEGGRRLSRRVELASCHPDLAKRESDLGAGRA